MNKHAGVFILRGIPIIPEAQHIFIFSIEISGGERQLYMDRCLCSACLLFRGQCKCAAGPETALLLHKSTLQRHFQDQLHVFLFISAQCVGTFKLPPRQPAQTLGSSSVQFIPPTWIHSLWCYKEMRTRYTCSSHQSCKYPISPTQGRNSSQATEVCSRADLNAQIEPVIHSCILEHLQVHGVLVQFCSFGLLKDEWCSTRCLVPFCQCSPESLMHVSQRKKTNFKQILGTGCVKPSQANNVTICDFGL